MEHEANTQHESALPAEAEESCDSVLLFTAAWAPAAQALERGLSRNSVQVPECLVIADVDTDPAFADRHVVRVVPTVVHMKGNREVRRYVGAISVETLMQICSSSEHP